MDHHFGRALLCLARSDSDTVGIPLDPDAIARAGYLGETQSIGFSVGRYHTGSKLDRCATPTERWMLGRGKGDNALAGGHRCGSPPTRYPRDCAQRQGVVARTPHDEGRTSPPHPREYRHSTTLPP
jgi:hypothetical protein